MNTVYKTARNNTSQNALPLKRNSKMHLAALEVFMIHVTNRDKASVMLHMGQISQIILK